jgi:hypothetical protein
VRSGFSVVGVAAFFALSAATLFAHSGPPFPIVSDQSAGPYKMSVWTDPDATDDGTPGGQFWVTIELADGSEPPPDTRARVTIRPLDRPGAGLSGNGAPVDGDVSRQFVVLLMDHEGRFDVRTEITGALGSAAIDAWVDATYDLRPPPILLALYLMPFLVVGVLWFKLLRRRRAVRVQP